MGHVVCIYIYIYKILSGSLRFAYPNLDPFLDQYRVTLALMVSHRTDLRDAFKRNGLHRDFRILCGTLIYLFAKEPWQAWFQALVHTAVLPLARTNRALVSDKS